MSRSTTTQPIPGNRGAMGIQHVSRKTTILRDGCVGDSPTPRSSGRDAVATHLGQRRVIASSRRRRIFGTLSKAGGRCAVGRPSNTTPTSAGPVRPARRPSRCRGDIRTRRRSTTEPVPESRHIALRQVPDARLAARSCLRPGAAALRHVPHRVRTTKIAIHHTRCIPAARIRPTSSLGGPRPQSPRPRATSRQLGASRHGIRATPSREPVRRDPDEDRGSARVLPIR